MRPAGLRNAPYVPLAGEERSRRNPPLSSPVTSPAQLYHGSPLNLRQPQTPPRQIHRRPYIAPPTPSTSGTDGSFLLRHQLQPPSPGPPYRSHDPPSPSQRLAVPAAKRPPLLKKKASDVSLDAPKASSSESGSITDKYALATDYDVYHQHGPEPDDEIHNPDPRRDRNNDHGGRILTSRGLANIGCLVLLASFLFAVFVGYPIAMSFLTHSMPTLGAYNLGGTNGSGQIPALYGNWALIDNDTPLEAHTLTSYQDGSQLTLVFSDEFNVPNRTFYPGDDPYWEAVDIYYWGTRDLEWYDPQQIKTENGSLVIKLEQVSDAAGNHNLSYRSGMMSTWNKFCFTGGLIQVSATIPGSDTVQGLWPAIWTMGNLGRAGYGASLDGMWPYSYDSCDVGTLPNQTKPDGTPAAAATSGANGGPLSYLPGQRLSSCTCPDDKSHPGPRRRDGSFVGRSAPEIDVIEAQVSDDGVGQVSQSCQWAPFDAGYLWDTSKSNYALHQESFELNSYHGGLYQMATSAVGSTNPECYELKNGCSETYGFEYKPGNDGFITWISSGKASWTVKAAGLGPDAGTQIGQRPIPQEPMYILMNLGISTNFATVSAALKLPAQFKIDWVRVYQPEDSINIGCDPDGFPTTAYINQYIDAYMNANLTTWEQYGQLFPKNSFAGDC